MTIDVLRVPGDYKITTNPGGTLTLNVGGTGTNGLVVVSGNLLVEGQTTTIQSINATITDNVIMLNQGDPSVNPNNKVTNGISGIQISRGTYGGTTDSGVTSAFLVWDENYTWTAPGSPNLSNGGIFEFRVGDPNLISPTYSGIKINSIRLDPSSAVKGTDGNPRLSIFGSNADQQTAMLSVAGSGDYTARITDVNDIPNKQYVDNAVYSGSQQSTNLVVGHSYLKINDNFANGGVSEIYAVVNGNPNDTLATLSSGTVIMAITSASAVFNQLELINNSISTVGTNTNLVLAPNGTGTTIVSSPLVFQTTNVPSPTYGQTGIYGSTAGGGGTGIYFVNNSTGQNVTDEFVSRKKAIIYSLIF